MNFEIFFVVVFKIILPMTFGQQALGNGLLCLAHNLKLRERVACSLLLSNSPGLSEWSSQWRECLRFVLFTIGQNVWKKVDGSVAESGLFCICEFVFLLHSLISWLLDFCRFSLQIYFKIAPIIYLSLYLLSIYLIYLFICSEFVHISVHMSW